MQSYAQFNFLIDLGGRSPKGWDGGFQECSAIESNEKPGESNSITLKRGVINRLSFSKWLEETGEPKKSTQRTIVIRLLNEDRSIAQVWRLQNARIIKHTSGPLNAKGTDVAMEELTLGYERFSAQA